MKPSNSLREIVEGGGGGECDVLSVKIFGGAISECNYTEN